MDIGAQILASIKNSTSMREYYDAALASGEPVDFVLGKPLGFNMNSNDAIRTNHWPIGRYSAEISGTISVNGDGSYSIQGVAKVIPDTYSWEQDSSPWGNFGISILGRNLNGPDRGDMRHGSLASVFAFRNNPEPGFSGFALLGDTTWESPSSSLPSGRLEIQYNRDYNFRAWGNPN